MTYSGDDEKTSRNGLVDCVWHILKYNGRHVVFVASGVKHRLLPYNIGV